jgi:NADH:ubiquinone oxidoreductase subunit E
VQVEIQKAKAVLAKHNNKKKALIPILQDIQAEFNYLPRICLQTIGQSLAIPMVDIIGVATFYRAFSLKPRGKHLVTVCLGTACHVRGGPRILDEFEKRLAIKAGETTPDRRFTLETVACLGCCAIGPVVVVDGKYYAQTNLKSVPSILKKYGKK